MPSTPSLTELPPLTGDQVGRWRLGEVLGVGGMATVYAATGPDGEAVAVKVLHPGKTDDDEARRFRREFLTLRSLRHPAIVSVYEAGRAGSYPWIAMERIPGTDLESTVARWTTHPPADRNGLVERIFRDICEALAHIHGAGLIHRDLKPSNVLITPDHRAKLTDFGVVKAPFGQFHTQLTAVGSLVGTAAYMSPEQISGDPVDGRSDLYSLGAVLYVMLTGQRPIVADTVAGYLARHLNEAPRDPRELDPRVPVRVAQLCLRLLAKDPAQRYASAAQVLEALDDAPHDITHEAHGRSAELAAIHQQLTQLAPGHGGLIVLEGPRGSGRTTLLRTLVDQARAAGHGISMASGTSPDLLERLCSQIPSLGPSGSDGSAVDRIAARTRGRPWTLIIDDLEAVGHHALVDLTRLVRQQVAIEGDALLVIVAVAGRQGPVGTFCSGATTGLTPVELRLRPLGREAVVRLLRDLGIGGAACMTLARRLVDDQLATPARIRDRVDALVREGWMHRDIHGMLHLDRSLEDLRSAPLPVPTRARDALAAALDALDTADRTVLDTLVVLGGESDPDTLAEITELEAHVVERAVLRLARSGFAQEDTVGLHRLVRVSEAHPASVLYSLIEEAWRTRLHRTIATALQARRGRIPPSTIARHLLRGGQPADALPLLLRGATLHLRGGRTDEARVLLEDAARARPAAEATLAPDRVPRLRRELATLEAELAEHLRDPTRALAAWTRMRDAATEEGNASAVQRARAGMGMVWASFEDPRALRTLGPVWKATSRGDPLWPRTTRSLARALLAAGRAREARILWKRLTEHARDVHSAPLRAEAALGAALVRLAEDTPGSARTHLVEAEHRLRAAGSETALTECVLHLAELAHARGALIAASERAGEVVRSPHATPGQRLAGRALLVHCTDASARVEPTHPELDALFQEAADTTTANGMTWLARASAARALLAAAQDARAHQLLDPSEATVWTTLDDATGPGLTDPTGQVLALRARTAPDPDLATADAWSALGRDLPAFPIAAARIALDAARGLVRVSDPSAEDAVMEALDRTDRPELGLLRLEAAWLGARIDLVDPTELRALADQVSAASEDQPNLADRWRA